DAAVRQKGAGVVGVGRDVDGRSSQPGHLRRVQPRLDVAEAELSARVLSPAVKGGVDDRAAVGAAEREVVHLPGGQAADGAGCEDGGGGGGPGAELSVAVR